jgi:superfamily I DNA/RNA helicase
MRVLQSVAPTPEQLRIISKTTAGIEVIRGAAGSGKTTTAILRLRGLSGIFLNRRKSTGSKEPVRTLILTFNRTLRGYVQQLALEQAVVGQQIELDVDTFAHWAYRLLGSPKMASDNERRTQIKAFGSQIPLDPDFLCDEVDYVCGLYLLDARHEYLTAKRDGRGAVPRVDKSIREQILREVIAPYEIWKKHAALHDWSNLEVKLASTLHGKLYDIVIVDETQDFSANQIRALLHHAAKESAITFILDAAQRIYARGFTWSEVGIKLTQNNSHRLELNYRNTAEIAAFAAPIIEGITTGDVDATIPNLKGCKRHGLLPIVVVGKFNAQLHYAIEFIRSKVDLSKESAAFLQPKGGRWFDATREALARAKLGFVEITRDRDWPLGSENIALSTIHSAKGLEFDHVVLLGLNAEVLPHGSEPGDDGWNKLRRLLAMGVTRARTTVILGYKESDRSDLVDVFKAGTFKEVKL